MNDQGFSFSPCHIRIDTAKALTASLCIWKSLSDDTLSKSSLCSCWFNIKLLSAGKTFDHSGSPNSETPSKRSEVSQLQRWVPSYLCPTSSAGGSMPASGGQGTGFRHRWWRGPVRRAWNTVCISLHGLLKSEPLQCHNQAWQ